MLAFLNRAAAALRGASGASLVPGWRRPPPKRGASEILAAYSSSPILQAVARKIAFGVASVEWRAAVAREGRETPVPGHLMERLLQGGVPGLDGFQCRLAIELHLLLAGEGFAVLDRNALGAPVRRWPAPPHWIRETPVPGRERFVIQPEGGPVLTLPAADVLWFKDVDPLKPYERGSGVGVALDDELAADEHAAKHMGATLANRARPDVIVSGTVEAPFSADDKARIEELWTQRFAGPGRSGLPFFSRGPVSVHDLTPSFKELELTALRAYERDIIVSVFGVPPELVGILQNSNRATIESAEFLFTKHVVLPRLVARKAAIDDQLAPQYDPDLRAVFESPVDEDAAAKRAYMLARADAFTIDEHRAAAGWEPLPDGAGRRFPMPIATVYAEHGAAPAPAPAASPAKGLRHKAPADVPDELPDDFFASLLEAAYREAVAAFAAEALADIGVEIAFDVFDPAVAEWIRETAAERSRLIVGTTRERLRETLAEGVEAGEATAKLVRRIRETVADADGARARLIARTEIVQASNHGTHEAHKAAGIEEREWLATFDARVRDSHAALAGKRARIDEPFEVGGQRAMYPGGFASAALNVNCRCAVIPVIAGASPEPKRAEAVWRKTEATREAHEAALETRLAAAFRALADRAARALED